MYTVLFCLARKKGHIKNFPESFYSFMEIVMKKYLVSIELTILCMCLSYKTMKVSVL